MKEEIYISEIIQKYLNSEISKVEALNDIELSETEFDQEVEIQHIINEGFHLKRLDTLSKNLKTKNKTVKTVEKLKITAPIIALVIIVLIAIILIYNYTKTEKSTEELPSNSSKIEILKNNKQSISDQIDTINVNKNETKHTKYSNNNLHLLNETKKDTIYSTYSKNYISNESIKANNNNIHIVKEKQQEVILNTKSINTETDNSNICNPQEIKFEYNYSNTCSKEYTGKINIITALGGHKPYYYSIDNGLNYQEASNFEFLKKGIYYLCLKDNLNCKSSQIEFIEITETVCDETIENQFIFNPLQTELVINNTKQLSGIIEIYSNTGIKVFQKQFLNFESINWNGYSTSNTLLPPNQYIFKISYNNQSVENGTITITITY